MKDGMGKAVLEECKKNVGTTVKKNIVDVTFHEKADSKLCPAAQALSSGPTEISILVSLTKSETSTEEKPFLLRA